MVSFTLATASAILAATMVSAAPTAAAAQAPFYLETLVTDGPAKFNSKNVTNVHVGAGQDQGAVAKGTGVKLVKQANAIGTEVGSGSGKFYEFLNLYTGKDSRPENNDDGSYSYAVPAGYHSTGFSSSGQTDGFSVKQGKSGKEVLEYTGNVTKFETFAVCHVTAAEAGIYPGDLLLWRSKDVKADTKGQCADVELVAHYFQ